MLTTAPTDTESGLLRAILDMPECDNARLAYADWLDENAGEVECKACEGDGIRYDLPIPITNTSDITCHTCKGSGRVSDGRRERAEFIRVQCVVASPEFLYGDDEQREALRQRERELWGRFVGPLLTDEYGGHFDTSPNKCVIASTNGNGITMAVERGLVSTVSAPLAVLVGGECERCRNTETNYPPELHAAIFSNCSRCHGTGTRPGIAADLIRTQPVLSWLASDRKPGQYANTKEWYWAEWTHDVTYPVSTLPPEVFRLLAGQTHVDQLGSRSKHYPTEADALAALSDAVATIAKQQGEK